MPLFFFIEFARPGAAGENPIAGERERAGEDEKKSIPPPPDAARWCGIGLAADIGLSRGERRREEEEKWGGGEQKKIVYNQTDSDRGGRGVAREIVRGEGTHVAPPPMPPPMPRPKMSSTSAPPPAPPEGGGFGFAAAEEEDDEANQKGSFASIASAGIALPLLGVPAIALVIDFAAFMLGPFFTLPVSEKSVMRLSRPLIAPRSPARRRVPRPRASRLRCCPSEASEFFSDPRGI
jgi:hypothetical protein